MCLAGWLAGCHGCQHKSHTVGLDRQVALVQASPGLNLSSCFRSCTALLELPYLLGFGTAPPTFFPYGHTSYQQCCTSTK